MNRYMYEYKIIPSGFCMGNIHNNKSIMILVQPGVVVSQYNLLAVHLIIILHAPLLVVENWEETLKFTCSRVKFVDCTFYS